MAVVIETTIGDITVDLFVEQRPTTCLNFLKLCKMKYYNFNLFHTIQSGFIAQTGDPSGEGSGGQSIWGLLEGQDKRFFSGEMRPKIRHSDAGLLSMVSTGDMMIGSQFFITLGADLDSLDGVHCVIGAVTEGHEVLRKLNDTICDESHRPYQDVRITHTVVLEDPFNDPPGLRAPSRSPSPSAERLKGGRIAPDEDIDELQGKSTVEIQEMIEEKEAKARATILEIIGDLPDADIAPPENVLFVCKLNPVTTDEDLEIIFSRFGKINSCEVIRDKKSGDSLQYAFIEFAEQKSCEDAYFKMDNVLIDDRRIHVDFSQSVSKIKWLGKGRGVKHINDEEDQEDSRKRKSRSHSRDRNRNNDRKMYGVKDNHREPRYRDNYKEHRDKDRRNHREERKRSRSRSRHNERRDRERNHDRNRISSHTEKVKSRSEKDEHREHKNDRQSEKDKNRHEKRKESLIEKGHDYLTSKKRREKSIEKDDKHNKNRDLSVNYSRNNGQSGKRKELESHKEIQSPRRKDNTQNKDRSPLRQKDRSPVREINRSPIREIHKENANKNYESNGKEKRTDHHKEHSNKVTNGTENENKKNASKIEKRNKEASQNKDKSKTKESSKTKKVSRDKSKKPSNQGRTKKKRYESTSSSSESSDTSTSSSSSSSTSSSSDSDVRRKKRKRKYSTSSDSSSSSSTSDTSDTTTSSDSSDSERKPKKRKVVKQVDKKSGRKK